MFESIQDYYDYLEKDKTLSFDFNVSKSLIKLRDKAEDTELKSICSYEMYFTDFVVFNGEITYHLKSANGETYPNFGLFKDDLKYIVRRSETVQNPKYRAKYNHLLWESHLKHNKYLNEAINNYFVFIQELSNLPENISNYEFESLYETLFVLTQIAKYKKDECIKFVISLLDTKKLIEYRAYSIVRFIAEHGKKIDSKVFQYFKKYSDEIIAESQVLDYKVEYLQLLIILCQKLNLSPRGYHNKIAEFHISQSQNHEDSFIIHDFYLKALAEYHKAGNKKKIEEVAILLEKAKKKINLKEIKYEHTDERLKEYWDVVIKSTDDLTDNDSSEEIYKYIIGSKNIFPKSEILDKKEESSILDFVTVINFDINKNVNDKKKGIINPYSIYMQNFSINHLWMIFSKGIKNGKISYDSLLQYFKTNSWYNQNLTYPNYSDQNETFNWLELLSPSLLSFFTQIEIDIKLNIFKNQGYILPIDSLTLKFEGLLREFSRFIGAQTIEYREDGTQERISFEKLLDNEKLQELIPKDDIALFKFIFLSDEMDLRNNIAHCFYRTKSYSSAIMLLLISSLLKLGNYEFKPIE